MRRKTQRPTRHNPFAGWWRDLTSTNAPRVIIAGIILTCALIALFNIGRIIYWSGFAAGRFG